MVLRRAQGLLDVWGGAWPYSPRSQEGSAREAQGDPLLPGPGGPRANTGNAHCWLQQGAVGALLGCASTKGFCSVYRNLKMHVL